MVSFHPIYAQYRTLDQTFLLKAKKDQSLCIKIYNLTKERIFKTRLSVAETGISNPHAALANESSFAIIDKLVQRNLTLSDLLLLEVSLESCLQDIEKLIHDIRQNLVFKNAEIRKFTCPITMEVFQKPVMDEHGHTFEKQAIELHLKNNKSCPISRQPINSLIPNLLIQQTIEEVQRQDPIPTFAVFTKTNPTLAEKNLEIADIYEKEGEFSEAIKAYATAFQYTKESQAYARLPHLFQRMKKRQKAILASLYLAQYQLQEMHVSQAIQTIKEIQEIDPLFFSATFLLVKLFRFNKQTEEAFQVILEKAPIFAKEHIQETINLYKQALMLFPENEKIYLALEDLLENPQEKSHLLLKRACHAIQNKDYDLAKLLCLKAEQNYPFSFIDQLIQINLLGQQAEQQPLKEKLLQMVQVYHEKNLPSQKLKIYKMLIYLEKDPIYFQQVINAYEQLQNSIKALKWKQKLLLILVEEKHWQTAETLAKELIESKFHSTSIYSILETIYTNWQIHKLSDFYTQLGEFQIRNQQIEEAEVTYRKAFECFQNLEHGLALADTLRLQNKITKSIQIYYENATNALLDDNLHVFDVCVHQIRKIDPRMQNLDASQKMHLLAHSKIFNLQKEVQDNRIEITRLRENLATFQILSKQSEVKLKTDIHKDFVISLVGFGATKWAQYFGDIGIEPPLPSNIHQILSSPCPFWQGKKIQDTHMLVLIPKAVNGRPFNLKILGELIKNPKQGNKTTYRYLSLGGYEDFSAYSSHWVLMTRHTIPDSQNKSYDKQMKIFQTYSKKVRTHYQIPNILDATTCLFLEYVATGTRLYSDNPPAYTRCQEKYNAKCQLIVGGFARNGLDISVDGHDSIHVGVAAVRMIS